MRMTVPRRSIRAGRERLVPGRIVPRHQHADAYATIVLAGAYEQLSYAGRLKAQAGDVLIQPTFDCHADRMLSDGVELIRLPWRREPTLGGIYRNIRIDPIRRAAERDIREATALLEEQLHGAMPTPRIVEDWSDRLAIDLAANPRLRIALWAEREGASREHVSRRFSTVFSVSPTQFRSELNARAAWLRITGSADPLCRIAADLAFADQAHMTRAVSALTGLPPSRWRSSHSFKTAALAAARLNG